LNRTEKEIAMFKHILIGAALLAASGIAAAHDGYRHGRVITVEPHFVVSFGSRHADGFRILYESGGHRYWTHSYHRPGPMIVVPPRPVYYYAPQPRYDRHWNNRHDRHWDNRHDRRHDRHDDRRGGRHDQRGRH
jgi:hypothetical protein